MKTQTRQYKNLKRLVGKEIIRIKPCECSYGMDYSYTDEPVKLVAVSKEEIVFQEKWSPWVHKQGAEWLDGNWYSVEDAMRFPKTKLHKLVGKKIRTPIGGFPLKLLCSTKYHLVAENVSGDVWWYSGSSADPNNWEEV